MQTDVQAEVRADARAGPPAAPRAPSPSHATVVQAGGSRPPAEPGCSPRRRLPLDAVFKTFNIKVKVVILDPEKHFVRLRSSRCKQSTTGTKPAPRRRRPRLRGRMAGEERGTGTGRVAGGSATWDPAPRTAPPRRSPWGANSPGWESPGSGQAAPGWRCTPGRSQPPRRLPSPLRPAARPRAICY